MTYIRRLRWCLPHQDLLSLWVTKSGKKSLPRVNAGWWCWRQKSISPSLIERYIVSGYLQQNFSLTIRDKNCASLITMDFFLVICLAYAFLTTNYMCLCGGGGVIVVSNRYQFQNPSLNNILWCQIYEFMFVTNFVPKMVWDSSGSHQSQTSRHTWQKILFSENTLQ